MPLAVFPKCFLRAMVAERTMTLDDWMNLVVNHLEVDGLEFYFDFTPAEKSERHRVRDFLRRRGLAAPMMCYAPDFIHRDPARRQREIAAQKRAIEAAADLGGQFCRVLSGQWKPDIARDDGLQMAADAIAECLPHARQHGICLTLENHYKATFWEYPEFAQRQEDFLDLLGRIPRSPGFGVNYDPSNAVIAGDDPLALLAAVEDRVVTMHASDRFFEGGTVEDLRRLDRDPRKGYAPFLRHGVIGRGLIDYDGIFSRLHRIGFKGWISIEDGEDPVVGMEHLRLSAEFLRTKMKQHGLP